MTDDPLPELPRVRAPEFPDTLDWIGVDGRPRLADLRGRVVLLDFWSYGCINCIHLVPQLRELERRFLRELVILGVHSGKHPAERVSSRIAHAMQRLGVSHPVLNDRQFRVWRSFAVDAWPTLVLIDPQGYVVGSRGGERTADELTPVIARLVAKHRDAGTLRVDEPASFAPTPVDDHRATLAYPGKVAVDVRTSRLAIADTAHHRILVGSLDLDRAHLHIDRIVGTGRATSDVAGYAAQGTTRTQFAARADGDASTATFDRPQGLAFGDDATLYVADAGNHAVRVVDLATGMVRTLAGTGVRLRTDADRANGALASPWDLARSRDALAVAMAGTHELWRVAPRDGEAHPIVGGRGEGLVDGAPLAASLAQPMGITANADALWFADAESSAVRCVDARGVHTLVGIGLFDFGDRDGVGDDARLQHVQGVAHAEDGRILVADSYNDALKWIDPSTRRVTTWVRDLSEPGGLAVGPRQVYVADTNAHQIVVIDRTTAERRVLTLG